jgi:hypothetical protein
VKVPLEKLFRDFNQRANPSLGAKVRREMPKTSLFAQLPDGQLGIEAAA